MGTHQQKKLDADALLAFRDRFALPLSDEEWRSCDSSARGPTSPEMAYLHGAAQSWAAICPCEAHAKPRRSRCRALKFALGAQAVDHHGLRALLAQLLKDAKLGPRIVPIVADEARTFGMQTLFRQIGIYSRVGQLYEPEDHDELLYYHEAKDGQILEEGITEAGALSSWLAAATATRRTARRCCRSTSTTRCSASSAWAT